MEVLKNKPVIAVVAVVAIVLSGGVFALMNRAEESKNATSMEKEDQNQTMAIEKKTSEQAAMEKAEQANGDEKMAKEGEAMQKDGEGTAMTKDDRAMAMSQAGSFSDYDQAKLANAEKGNVVLFFSASWCPTCQEANKNFNASSAPNGLTLLKVNYDSSNDLKKKYGVTYQHTFVQVDKDGNLIKKWSGSNNYSKLEAETI